MLTAIAAIALLAQSTTATPAWELLTVASDGTFVRLHTTSVMINRNVRKGWISFTEKKAARAVLNYTAADCAGRKLAIIEAITRVRGKVVDTAHHSYPEYTTPPPDSVGTRILEELCTYVPADE
jgi:hypothetical protein